MNDTDDDPISKKLRISDVWRIFKMGEVSVEVLKGISFEIEPGELLAIVGPSGSGKTTILNLIGGLDQPTSGRMEYGDENLATATKGQLTRYRREEVGFVFQLYNLVPNLTAYENVLVSTELSSASMDAAEALELVGLADRANHFPAQLSGGEQQRVAIARAFAKNPSLLLCDEPTGALDFQTGIQVLQLLVDLNRRLNQTTIIITHNSAIAEVADRVIRIRSGEISEITHNEHPKSPQEVQW